MGYKVAIDTGGTFTDSILVDDQGHHFIGKVPTTPHDTSIGIFNSIEALAKTAGNMTLEEFFEKCDVIIVGTTVAANVLAQYKGAKTCMITTKGFRDILEFTRIHKSDLFNWRVPKRVILIPRNLRFSVEERVLVTGEILTPLNEKDTREAARKAKALKCEVVTICFMHSYINSDNENKAAEIVREEYPEAEIVLSSDILPRPIEFDRYNTTALAGYVGPATVAYVKNLQKRFKDSKYKGSLLFTTSNAGASTPEEIIKRPIQLLSSGPAGGVESASFLGKLTGIKNIIAVDMGGTSYDISILPQGRIPTTHESIIDDQMNAADVVDVISIGAGGGSIAKLDGRGVLAVGPESASASPGPACYGKGGTRPTVTDADVILGYVPSDYFLGGNISLDVNLSKKAIKEHIADPLGVDVVKAAMSIKGVVDANMADQTLLKSLSQGYDPRDFSIFVGGGAGPTHAFDIANLLKIKNLYVPRVASAFCAFGMLGSDFKYEFSRVWPRIEAEINLVEINKIYESMEAQGVALLKQIKGLDPKGIKLIRGAEMRYFGQVFDMEATMPETVPGKSVTKKDIETLITNFHDRHEEMYGHCDRGMSISITSLKMVVIGKRPALKLAEYAASSKDPSGALKRSRSIFFKDTAGFADTKCYDGEKLKHGNVVVGPAVIEEKTTTVVIPANGTVTVDSWGNYVGKLS